MKNKKPRWVLVMTMLLLLYGTALLGYRGSRSLENLNKASGQVQQVRYQLEGSRNQTIRLLIRLRAIPITFKLNVGSRARDNTVSMPFKWEQQLRNAAVVTAYYDLDLAADEAFIYQLEADGIVLVGLSQNTLFNRIGSLFFLLLLLFTVYFGRKQLFPNNSTPRKPSRHAKRSR